MSGDYVHQGGIDAKWKNPYQISILIIGKSPLAVQCAEKHHKIVCCPGHSLTDCQSLTVIVMIKFSQIISLLSGYIKTSLSMSFSSKGRQPKKMLLFFWILSKSGGEGPAQFFCYLFKSAFLVNKRSLLKLKALNWYFWMYIYSIHSIL